MSCKERALILARNESDIVDIIMCPETDTELYFYACSCTFIFESFGNCVECDVSFHASALKLRQGMEKSPWPVQYSGLHCKSCYNKDA